MDYKNLTKEQLPKEFQDRIERFNRLFEKGTDHSFEEDDLYEYEMICIAQALSFIDYFKDKPFADIFKTIKDEYNYNALLFIYDIKDKVPFFYKNHFGKSLEMSWRLFECYKMRPDWIPYMHGCLSNLIGDEGYYDDRSDLPKCIKNK